MLKEKISLYYGFVLLLKPPMVLRQKAPFFQTSCKEDSINHVYVKHPAYQ